MVAPGLDPGPARPCLGSGQGRGWGLGIPDAGSWGSQSPTGEGIPVLIPVASPIRDSRIGPGIGSGEGSPRPHPRLRSWGEWGPAIG